MVIRIWCHFISNIPHSNHLSSHNWLMVGVSPNVTLLGTSWFSLHMPSTVFDIIYGIQFLGNHPKSLWCSRFIIFLLESSSVILSISQLHLTTVNVSICLKWCDASLSFLLTQNPFFGIVIYYCWWNSILLKEKYHGLHFSASFGERVTNQSQLQISVYTYYLS